MAGEARFEARQGESGQWYWVLIAANNEILAMSETFNEKGGAERGIASARRAVLEESAARLDEAMGIPIE